MSRDDSARKEMVDYWLTKTDEARDQLVLGDKPYVLPSRGWIEKALEDSLTLKGHFYSRPPVFRESPEASMLLRITHWHFSGGNLHTPMIVGWDLRTYVEGGSDEEWKEWCRDLTYDSLINLSLLFVKGKSNALNQWQRAIYG